MIDYTDAERALEFLKHTDITAGKAKAYYEAMSDMKKTTLAMIYNSIKEGSAADKAKKAEGHLDYQLHLEKTRKACEDWEVMRNKRNTAALQIEMWRSVNSNQRKGNI